ncbi:MAG: pyruvate kinase [Bacteroidota bacterium]
MPFRLKEEKLQQTLRQIETLIANIKAAELKYADQLEQVHPIYRKSAANLIHYRTLREADLTDIQKQLGRLGLSRLAKAQGHVLASLYANKSILESLISGKPIQWKRAPMGVKEGNKLTKSNAKSLLGYRSKGRRTRIMVTQPNTVAEDYQLAYDMVKSGMNAARINCAHDSPEVWLKMIQNIRKASNVLNKKVRIAMDLGGPKIRTGAMVPGPKVVKFTPDRDVRGNIIQPTQLWVGPEANPELAEDHLPVDLEHLEGLQASDRLVFNDTRNKKRQLIITHVYDQGLLAACFDAAYLETGMLLYHEDMEGRAIPVGEIPEVQQRIILHPGDRLRLHREPFPGAPTQYDESGKLVQWAHISCTAPSIFDRVQVGEPIRFDDGKIEGTIASVTTDEMWIDIVRAKAGGAKLRADKGINFPQSDLQISGLTDKDRRDMAFVAEHADVVNMSFVNNPQDIQDLIAEIDKYGARDKLGVILKIETQSGFDQLTDILLEAMQLHPIGVMIARGDLAIEVGWNNIGRVQEEIMALCQAAHVTDVWATQVLESLAKKGVPSRAEITDATKAQRADCVMLNKGTYILEAITLLDSILKGLDAYQDKNAPLTPKLERAES